MLGMLVQKYLGGLFDRFLEMSVLSELKEPGEDIENVGVDVSTGSQVVDLLCNALDVFLF